MVVLITGGCVDPIKDRNGFLDYPESSVTEFWSYDGYSCLLPDMVSARNEHYQIGDLGSGSKFKVKS